MHDELNPVVPVKLGGKIFHIKYSLGSLYKFKELTSIDIFRSGANITDMEANHFKTMVWACLPPEERQKLTLKKIGKIVNKKTIFTILPPVTLALKLAFPKPEEKKDMVGKDEKPEVPPCWPEIWAFGRQTLKLGEEEFWQLTPAQFIRLVKRWQKEEETLDFRTGIIASSILNLIPRTKKTEHKIYTAADIFPHYGWDKKKNKKSLRNMTAEEKLEHYRLFAALMGAKETGT